MHCCCMLENTGSAKIAFYCQFRSVFGQIPFRTGFRTEISKSDVVRKIGRFGSTALESQVPGNSFCVRGSPDALLLHA